jgi:hypothetical protein
MAGLFHCANQEPNMPKRKPNAKPASTSRPKLTKDLMICLTLTRIAASVVQRLRSNAAQDRAVKRN